MKFQSRAVGSLIIAVGLFALAGCDSDTNASSSAPQSSAPDASAPVESSPAAEPVSDIQAAAQEVVDVLDELGIEHSGPVRSDVQASGATAVFDITINGYDAGINVFEDAESLAEWQDLSDSFGGVSVTFDNAALSLNSSDGIADSVEIAPKIAEKIGGEAHGV